MVDPIEAVRAKPGEYFLATDKVEVGLQFRVRDTVYKVTGEPRRWGPGWMAKVQILEGLRPGIEFQAMLRTGTRIDPS